MWRILYLIYIAPYCYVTAPLVDIPSYHKWALIWRFVFVCSAIIQYEFYLWLELFFIMWGLVKKYTAIAWTGQHSGNIGLAWICHVKFVSNPYWLVLDLWKKMIMESSRHPRWLIWELMKLSDLEIRPSLRFNQHLVYTCSAEPDAAINWQRRLKTGKPIGDPTSSQVTPRSWISFATLRFISAMNWATFFFKAAGESNCAVQNMCMKANIKVS